MKGDAQAQQGKLSLMAVGSALTATLVTVYVGCWLAAFLVPGVQGPHGWLGLFTTAPPMSLPGLVGGIVSNVAFAWLAAAVYVPVFNWLSNRHA